MRKLKRIFIYISAILTGTLLLVLILDANLFRGLFSKIQIYNISNTERSDKSSCLRTKTDVPFIICIFHASQDIFISKSLLSSGIWEPKMTKLFQAVLQRNRNMTVIDIGANIGYFSLLSAAFGHHVLSIEPVEENLLKFANAVNLNNFHGKITVLRNVVSNTRGHLRLILPSGNNQGAARILTQKEYKLNTNAISISSIVLDDLTQFIHTRDVMIKIDVEGHECRAIENSDVIFDTFRVKYVMTEWSKMTSEKYRYGVACGPNNIKKMAEKLTQRGFIPYDVSNNQQLDPIDSMNWRYNDIYWKHETLVS